MYRMPMTAVRQYVSASGSHWFDRGTMRFFQSRVGMYAYQDAQYSDVVYFVSSERGPGGVRRYSVRRANIETGTVETVGDFQAYSARATADAAARRFAMRGE